MRKKKKTAVEQILEDRPATHGSFAVGAAFTQGVMRMAEKMPAWPQMTDVEREGFHMIIHKLHRALAGDPHCAEHWNDAAGYAARVAEQATN